MREMSGQSTENFQHSGNILYDTIMLDKFHYTFVQTNGMYNVKSEPQGKLWTLGDDDVSTQIY